MLLSKHRKLEEEISLIIELISEDRNMVERLQPDPKLRDALYSMISDTGLDIITRYAMTSRAFKQYFKEVNQYQFILQQFKLWEEDVLKGLKTLSKESRRLYSLYNRSSLSFTIAERASKEVIMSGDVVVQSKGGIIRHKEAYFEVKGEVLLVVDETTHETKAAYAGGQWNAVDVQPSK